MNQHWQSEPIGSLCQLVNGRAFKPSDWTEDGLPIVRIQNLNDETKPFNYYNGKIRSKYLIEDGDVLLSWSGTPGTSFGCFGWTRGQAILNQHIFKVLVDTRKMLKDFFIYSVNSRLDEMISLAHGGVGLRHITKKKLERINLPVPPLEEQRRIVDQIRKVFERWHAVCELRQEIHSEATTVFPTLLADCFDPFINSDSIPIRTVGQVALETRYGTSRRCRRTPNGSPVLRIPNVVDGQVNLIDLKWCNQLSKGELSKLSLQDGDVLVVRTNGSRDLVGRCAVFEEQDRPYAYASYLIRIRPNCNLVHPQFLAFFLASALGRDAISERMRTSAGQFNINSTNLRSIPLPCPPLEVQRSVVKQMIDQRRIINGFMAAHSNIQNEDVTLRQAVLRKAFTGEL